MTNQLFPLLGYEGTYSITKDGRIWSHPKGCNCNRSGKWLKYGIRRGYYYVTLYSNGSKKLKSIHRLVAENWIPNLDSKPQVNHLDGIKSNNDVTNLEWATPQENRNHAELNGLSRHYKTSKFPSKYTGVCWDMGRWKVSKRINGIRYNIGRFIDEEVAHQAYLSFHTS